MSKKFLREADEFKPGDKTTIWVYDGKKIKFIKASVILTPQDNSTGHWLFNKSGRVFTINPYAMNFIGIFKTERTKNGR